jgi:glyoxylase-like metal-dependent hydrolase (beta-lactamase superfamily II)
MENTAQDSDVKIRRLELGPFGTNAYIVVCQATGDSILVDAPAEAGEILRQLDGTNPRYIVITHSHFDHIMALDELKAELKIPVAVHPLDAANLPSRPDVELADGDTINVGQLKVKTLHTPGHTPGGLSFLVGKYLISGDTIFPGGPGKTGTPADFKQIVDSIVTKILVLPDDTEVCPGHGDPTVLVKEKKEFTIFASRSHDSNLCGDVLWLSL